GECDVPVLDPEAGGAAAVVASDSIDTKPNQLSDIEALLDVGHQFIWRQLTGREIEIGRGGRRRAAGAAGGVACCLQLELPRRGAVEQPGGKPAVLDQDGALGR